MDFFSTTFGTDLNDIQIIGLFFSLERPSRRPQAKIVSADRTSRDRIVRKTFVANEMSVEAGKDLERSDHVKEADGTLELADRRIRSNEFFVCRVVCRRLVFQTNRQKLRIDFLVFQVFDGLVFVEPTRLVAVDVVLKTEAYVEEPPQRDFKIRLAADVNFFFNKLFENHFCNFEFIVFNGSAEKKAEQRVAIARTGKKINKKIKFWKNSFVNVSFL
jgi:hypothetical protein